MADRRDDNKLILVAGVVIGAGILALLYKMFMTGNKTRREEVKFKAYNQQVGSPAGCTCKKGGQDRFFSSEERERQERERKRQEEARLRALLAAFEPDDPPPRFSPLQLACGTLGFLLALMALLFKTVDNDRLHDILDVVGLGHLVPKKIKPGCLNPARMKWPTPPPKQKRC